VGEGLGEREFKRKGRRERLSPERSHGVRERRGEASGRGAVTKSLTSMMTRIFVSSAASTVRRMGEERRGREPDKVPSPSAEKI